ncbi:hypothetical protein [Halobaculum sp. EA56]|uniref:hypothetical protein n=1 Tax=Halobaculum sp. EA56 TaxID=3421648 RepID=UPI003EBAAED9
MTLYAYVLPLDQTQQSNAGMSASRQVASNAGLNSSGAPESAGVEPGGRRITGFVGGTAADEIATELKELGGAPSTGFETIPLYGDSDSTDLRDGYYILASVSTSPAQPQAFGKLHQYEVRLEAVGTRRSHWRAATTEPAALTSDFGSDEKPYLAAPNGATNIRWFDPGPDTLERPSSVETVTTGGGDVDLYDPSASSIASPELLYTLPYGKEGDTDVRLWDDRGNASKLDGNGNVSWQRAFQPDHEFSGAAVFSNRKIRVTINDDAQTISAERYASGSWSSVTLGTSDWVPLDVDVQRIEPAVVEADVLFDDTASSSFYTLRAIVHRGWSNVQWVRPSDSAPPTPSGLQTLLDPIASPRYETPNPTTGLRSRDDVPAEV